MERVYNKAYHRPTSKDFLPLHAKVAAINLYDKNPVYLSVSRHFPCSAKYIKQIIDSRDEILKEWDTQINILNSVCTVKHRASTQREKQLLNNKMDVWLRGCMDDPNFVATDELIVAKTSNLMKLYNFTNFVPDADWISGIRKKYDRKSGEDPPSDAPEADTSRSEEDNTLAAEDQVKILINDNQNTNLWNNDGLNRSSMRSFKSWRMLMVELLDETVYEWILRMQSRGSGNQITTKLIVHAAQEVNIHIKVYNYNPRDAWLKNFILKYNLMDVDLSSQGLYKLCGERKDHLPLRIPDIIDFVQQRNKFRSATGHRYRITYSKSKCGEVVVPVGEGACNPRTSQERGLIIDNVVPVKCEEVAELAEDGVPMKGGNVKPGSISFKCSSSERKRMAETIADRVHHKPIPVKRCKKTHSRSKCRSVDPSIVPIKGSSTSQKSSAEVAEIVFQVREGAYKPRPSQERGEIIDEVVPVTCEKDVDDDITKECEEVGEIVDFGVPMKCGNAVPCNVPIKSSSSEQQRMAEVIEIIDDDDPVKSEEVVDDDVPLKIKEILKGHDPVDDDNADVRKERPPKVEYDEEECLLSYVETDDSGSTRKFIRSDEDALRYLKALEDFVLLESNFRAIGVISNLEAMFRNSDVNH